MDVSKIIVIVQKFDFILDNDAKANSVPKKTKVGVLYVVKIKFMFIFKPAVK